MLRMKGGRQLSTLALPQSFYHLIQSPNERVSNQTNHDFASESAKRNAADMTFEPVGQDERVEDEGQ